MSTHNSIGNDERTATADDAIERPAAPTSTPHAAGDGGMPGGSGRMRRVVRRRQPTDPTSPAWRLAQANAGLKRINVDLTRANANLTRSVEELQAFAGEISHDLKSHLVTMAGYAQLLGILDLGESRPSEFDQFVTEIENGVERARWLIDEMLVYACARGARLHPTRVELGPLVAEVVAARTRHLAHRATAGEPMPEIVVDPLPAVRADRAMLWRVIDNLVSNAIKYVRPGQAAKVHITACQDGDGTVRIEIADRGIGIPDGQHEAVFNGLHRPHAACGYPGTGLGLAICRRIVQRHGGAIGATPEPGGGTRMWLRLPAPDATIPPGALH